MSIHAPQESRETGAQLTHLTEEEISARASHRAERSQVSRPPRPDASSRAPGVSAPARARAGPAQFLTPSASSQKVERHCRVSGEAASSGSLRWPSPGWSPSGALPALLGWDLACPLPSGTEPAQAGVWRQRRRRLSARPPCRELVPRWPAWPALAGIRAPPRSLTWARASRPRAGRPGLGRGAEPSQWAGEERTTPRALARHRGASLAGRTWADLGCGRGGAGPRSRLAAGEARRRRRQRMRSCARPRRPGRRGSRACAAAAGRWDRCAGSPGRRGLGTSRRA